MMTSMIEEGMMRSITMHLEPTWEEVTISEASVQTYSLSMAPTMYGMGDSQG